VGPNVIDISYGQRCVAGANIGLGSHEVPLGHAGHDNVLAVGALLTGAEAASFVVAISQVDKLLGGKGRPAVSTAHIGRAILVHEGRLVRLAH
jgi:hypothetical protein